MEVILTIIAILVISHLLMFLGKKIKIPGVVMLIIAGLVFNIGFLEKTFILGNQQSLITLGTIGLFVLMFLAGLEISWKKLYEEKRNSAFIAFFASLLPFALGLIIFYMLGFPLLTSAVVGITMAITAEATKARVLFDLKKLKTKLGTTMMGAGMIDDLIGLALFLIVAFIFSSWSNESLITIGAIAAFFLGVISHKAFRSKEGKTFFEKTLMFLFVPFFFISIGIHFDPRSLTLNPLILLLLVSIAISGKIVGVLLTKHFTKFKNKQLLLIGWAMYSRGAVELALALIAFNIGLLNAELYSGIILMALITTLIFPFIITRMIKKNPKIMN